MQSTEDQTSRDEDDRDVFGFKTHVDIVRFGNLLVWAGFIIVFTDWKNNLLGLIALFVLGLFTGAVTFLLRRMVIVLEAHEDRFKKMRSELYLLKEQQIQYEFNRDN